MAYIGIKGTMRIPLGDVPDAVLADPVFTAQFDAIQPDRMEVQRRCRAHILKHYEEYQQLNVLMSGTDAEKSRMSAFVLACRAWSNRPNPVLADLDAIQP